jgi:hypothetical protein
LKEQIGLIGDIEKPKDIILPVPNNRKRARWLTFVLLFLFVANVFDPGGAPGVRYVAFVVACLATLGALKSFYLPPRALILGLVLFVVWPIWELFYGLLRDADFKAYQVPASRIVHLNASMSGTGEEPITRSEAA